MTLLKKNGPLLWLLRIVAVSFSLLLCACQSLPASTASIASISATQQQRIDDLLRLIDQRLSVAVMVAQTKWNSGAPINDPVREQKILDDLAATFPQTDPQERLFTRRFFQAQFDAGKIIQVSLHAQWRKEQRAPFAAPPDLARDIRPKLDRLTPLLIDALKQVWPLLPQAAARQYLQQRSEILVRGDVDGAVRQEAIRVLLEDPKR